MSADRKNRVIPILLSIIGAAVILYVLLVALPNFNKRLDRSRERKVESDLNSIETALVAVLADAGHRDFHSLIDKDEFQRVCDFEMERAGVDAFVACVRIYSTLAPALLEHGNDTGEFFANSVDNQHLSGLVSAETLRHLGNSYMSPAPKVDPWGSPYQLYFGPWRSGLGPIPLRSYIDESSTGQRDALTVSNPVEVGGPSAVGFAPSSFKPLYIWSLGKNRQSDQAVFDSSGQYSAPASDHYRKSADPRYLGGGDDINNWDKNRSYRPFYEPIVR